MSRQEPNKSSPAPAGGLGVGTVLGPSESLATALAAGHRVIQLDPKHTYTIDDVFLPDGTQVIGNGAQVQPSSPAHGCFVLSRVSNVTIDNVAFVGQPTSALNQVLLTGHVAIQVVRSTNYRITGCTFQNWQGAGITVQGDRSDDYMGYRSIISHCTFGHCYFAFSATDRAEYGLLANSIIKSCRVGIWNSSGNWTFSGIKAVVCRAPFLSMAATSPFGAQSSDNWQHGTVVGCEWNHQNRGGQDRWTDNTAFMIGGLSQDPEGVVFDGVLPPTYVGNTHYYCDFTLRNRVPMDTPTQLVGCVFSKCTVRSDTPGTLALVGCTEHEHAVLTNAMRITADTVGDLAALTTTDKSSLVAAINELADRISRP